MDSCTCTGAYARPEYEGPEPDERERAVLTELADECDAHVSFQGLRRRLGLHQQLLVRVLRRLEREGLVAKEEDGYRITEQGAAAVPDSCGGGPKPALRLLQALLPPHVPAEEVARALSGRWFRGLHWYGRSEAPGETTLSWLTDEDNALVRVRIHGGLVSLDVDFGETRPEDAMTAARGILSGLADLYALTPPAPEAQAPEPEAPSPRREEEAAPSAA